MEQSKFILMLKACLIVLGLTGASYALAQSSSSSSSSCAGGSTASSSSSSSQAPPSVQCSVTGVSDWGGSFQTNVDVTNTSDETIDTWAVALELAESHTVTNSWSVELDRDGTALLASNADWNGRLQPGETASFGFSGAYSGAFVEPACATDEPDDDGVNNPPQVDFTVEATGRTVYVDAGATSDPDGDELEYVIDFDVFDSVSQPTGWHTFFVPGDYRITVTVDDGELIASDSKVITVGPGSSDNTPPVAKLFLTSNGGNVGIYSSLSFDPDGDPLDKTAVRVNDNGEARVTLTVHDGELGDSTTSRIRYGCDWFYDPVANPRFSFRIDGNTVHVDARETWSSIAVEWDFGDGSATQSGVLASHTYAEPGQYDITLHAQSTPNRRSKTVPITIGEGANHEPRAHATCWERTLDGDDYWVECQARGSNRPVSYDPDGDDLTLTWNMDDGTTYTTESIDEPVRHHYSESGAYDVELTVSDGEFSATDMAWINVLNVGNRQPVACFHIQEDETTATPMDVVVDATCSSDADNDPLQYSWSFAGDNAEGVTAKHTFDGTGWHSVILTVSDGIVDDTMHELWLVEDVDESAPAVCEYDVTNEWNGGFTGQVTITNDGDEAIEGWEVAWDYTGGDRITNAWNADVSGDNPYTASDLVWNSRIEPGQSVAIGFQGTKSGGAAEVPDVTGAVCQ